MGFDLRQDNIPRSSYFEQMSDQRIDPAISGEMRAASEAPPPASRSPGPIVGNKPLPVVSGHRSPTHRTHHLVWLLPLAAIIVATAGAAWFFMPPAVEVISPIRGPAVEAVYATGTVEASALVPIAGRITGRIAEIAVKEGEEVSNDQVLLRFEDDDALQTLRQLEAQEVLAKKELDRVTTLRDHGNAAQSAYDRAFAEWQAASAARSGASVQVGYRTVTSPGAGRIVKRDAEVGQLVTANQPVLWLSADDRIRITTSIDEEDVARVRVGQPVLIRADAFPQQVFDGRVASVTPMGDPVARNYRVRIELQGGTPLLIGMTADTNIILRNEANALLVPNNAIADGAVWTVVDDRLVRKPVAVGVKGSERTEILTGLSDTDRIAVPPSAGFKAGERIRATTRAAQ